MTHPPPILTFPQGVEWVEPSVFLSFRSWAVARWGRFATCLGPTPAGCKPAPHPRSPSRFLITESMPVVNSRELQQADSGTPLEVLPPVMFNTFKHHAGSLRARLDALRPGDLAGF